MRRSPGEGWKVHQTKDGRYRTGFTDPSGRRRHISAKTAKEARAKRDKALRDAQLGVIAPPHRQTVGAFLEAWINDSIAPHLATRTTIQSATLALPSPLSERRLHRDPTRHRDQPE